MSEGGGRENCVERGIIMDGIEAASERDKLWNGK